MTTRRTRARSLVLINWKGVFYERYELDRGVTALEGENGAGKTTVMIAAYSVLLPDLTYLRFANVGESVRGGDRGVWGRLADEGPAYAVLELELGKGERLLAGVHLERGPEPDLAIEPFVVDSLEWDVSLQDVLLQRSAAGDSWPEPDELADACLRAGGRLRWFKKNKSHYFRKLFDLGVTPVLGVSSEDRQKLNDMLRTCMMGGIGQALRGGLRDFLFKKEARLGAAVKRMEENLLACRKTRSQVRHTRGLQADLEAVLEAGQRMFTAALLGERARVRETGQILDAARVKAEEAREQVSALETEFRRLGERHNAAELRHEQAREAANVARELLDRTRRAVAEADAAARLREELVGLRAALASAEAENVAAEEAAREARERRDSAQVARERAAAELGDYEEAYRAIRNRVASYREAVRRLGEAQEGLERADLDAAGVPAALAELEAECSRREAALLELEQACSLAEGRRQRFEDAAVVLSRVLAAGGKSSGSLLPAEVGDVARAELAHLAHLDDESQRVERLAEELVEAEVRASEQVEARAKAEALGVAGSAGLREAHAAAEADCRERRAVEVETRARVARLEVDEGRACERIESLAAEVPRWEAVQAEAAALADQAVSLFAPPDGSPPSERRTIASRGDLEQLTEQLNAARDAARSAIAEADAERDTVRARIREVRDGGGHVPEALLTLRDSLDATLVAERYEDLPLHEAARVEAALGPLAGALVVADVGAAAQAAAAVPELSSVWFLEEEGAEAALDPSRAIPLECGAILVGPAEREEAGEEAERAGSEASGAWRVSRLPERPVLGRAARERELATLDERLAELELAREQAGSRRLDADGALARARSLAAESSRLEAADPRPLLAEAREAVESLGRRLIRERRAVERLERELAESEARRSDLVELLPLAARLDPPDWAARRSEVEGALTKARAARAHLERVGDDRAELRRRLADLDVPPPSPEELEELRQAATAAAASLARRREPLVALRYLGENAEHLTWGDAEAALEEQTPLRERLQAAVARAKEGAASAETARDEAEAALDRARDARSSAHAKAEEGAQALARREEALVELAIADPSPEGLATAESEAKARNNEESERGREQQELRDACVRTKTQLEVAQKTLTERSAAVRDARRQHEPKRARLEGLEARATEAGVVPLPPALTGELEGGASVALSVEASSARERLVTLLERAEGGKELASRLRAWEPEGAEETPGTQYLRAWVEVRTWLQERLPAHLNQVDDPLRSLAELADYLARLEERLREKEADLGQDSQGIGNAIRSRIRSARSRVRTLNRDLAQVGFGSIRGVELQLKRVERMEALLEALTGDADLFAKELPVEEALEALFQSLGGGKVRADRLLDYRSYVELHVRVERRNGWEDVRDSNRLSTGEAIGVGAAVMMVILKAWEEDATLLRKKRATGSMRLLFLDEATRLSGDSLGALFELCGKLELQLLLAAPEVAQAQGATVYRLVRGEDERGREQVLVTGRRLVGVEAG